MDPSELPSDEFFAGECLENIEATEQDDIGNLGMQDPYFTALSNIDFPYLTLFSGYKLSPPTTPIDSLEDVIAAAPVCSTEYAQITVHESRPKPRKGSKTYQCDKCPRSFSNLKSYGDHMRTEHNVQAFKCRSCNKRVARHDNLGPHEKNCKGLQSIGDKRSVLAGSDVIKESGRPEKRHRAKAPDISEKTASKTPVTTPIIPASPNESDSPPFSASGSDDEVQEAGSLVFENKTLKEELNKSNADLASLRVQLRELALERDLWKQNYLQLKLQGDKIS
ncbi:hypothetical protein TWF506_008010 [Arthrobotrys conoides]|uniref:C2H2-type domain-containing protein n=1 Tax=Arthrobotrys conoides TaxID=74498 RepID=A0AAN8NDS5_9PEZI